MIFSEKYLRIPVEISGEIHAGILDSPEKNPGVNHEKPLQEFVEELLCKFLYECQ